MKIISILEEKWKNYDAPFLIKNNVSLYFKDFLETDTYDLSEISKGDIVLLVGDFDPISIMTFLN